MSPSASPEAPPTRHDTAVPSVFKLSIPVAMGYIPLGMAFGFLLTQAGAVWWLAPVMSLFIYAGAAQFMVVPMLASGQTLAAIALATLVVNLRHIFYGLSVLDRLPDSRWARTYLAWALTDESYSLITTLPPEATPRQVVGVAMINHAWWILGSTLGAVIGTNVAPSLQGFDFSLAALFAVLVVAQWRSHHQVAPLVTAVLSYALAWRILPEQALLISIALSVLVCILLSLNTARTEAPR
ncbi:MAG: AzlC family ABC transporter permease [Lautropia sp.]|nr:AzlC family ABC transporter permease [Lautropia sp.]